ncbi:MAG: aldo/keto reductase [Bacteroidota bacterium]
MTMDKVALAPNGPQLSRIVAGTMTWGEWGADYPAARMGELIQHCLDLGITSFDHADIYGHYSTEETFGQALTSLGTSVRAQIQLITKCGIRLTTHRRPDNLLKSYDTSKDYIIASAERSLKNLGTDYLDLFLIHRPDPLMQPAEVAEAFENLRTSGKVKHFGVSNFTPSQFTLLNSFTPLTTNQIECNPLHTESLFDGTLDQLLQASILPMVWSPLGGSKYFNGEGTAVLRLRDAVQQIAAKHGDVGEDVILLAWLLKHPSRPVPVVGTTKEARLTGLASALKIDLSRQDWFAILEAARGFEVA